MSQSRLQEAARAGQHARLLELLDSKSPLTTLNYQNRQGQTALHIVWEEMNSKRVTPYNCETACSVTKKLIITGAAVDLHDDQKQTAVDLMVTALYRHPILAGYLGCL